jgi:hypothetical protein
VPRKKISSKVHNFSLSLAPLGKGSLIGFHPGRCREGYCAIIPLRSIQLLIIG